MQDAPFLVLIAAAAITGGITIVYFVSVSPAGPNQTASGKDPPASIPCDGENRSLTTNCTNPSNNTMRITSLQNNSKVIAGGLEVNGTITGNSTFIATNQIAIKHFHGNNSIAWQGGIIVPDGIYNLTTIISKMNGNSSPHHSIIINATSAPAGNAKMGIYIPMYSISTLGSFLTLMKVDGPSLPYIVSINPNSGPGSSIDSRFTSAIATLHTSGLNVTVIGYVPTGYGTSRTVANVEGMIDTWYSLYPNIDGIMFDEVSSSSSTDSFYKAVTDYARTAHGAHFLRGNPGAPIDAGKVGMFDTIDVGESGSYPSMSSLQSDTFNGAYNNAKFGFIVHDQSTLDTAWLTGAEKYLGYVYITNDVEPNPYNMVPSYFAQELITLQAQ